MESRTPKLLDHLDSRGVPPEVLACDFFLSLGCRALPPRSVLRVWDMLFWEGGDTLQYVALAVLRLAEVSVCVSFLLCFRIWSSRNLDIERSIAAIPHIVFDCYEGSCCLQ